MLPPSKSRRPPRAPPQSAVAAAVGGRYNGRIRKFESRPGARRRETARGPRRDILGIGESDAMTRAQATYCNVHSVSTPPQRIF